MNPRSATVSIQVQGASTAIDLGDNLIDFEFTESIRNAGCTVKISLSDPDLLFLTSWNIQNGTQIRAYVTLANWDGFNAPPVLDTGICWVDTINLKAGRQGYVVTFTASSIGPDMLRDEKHHKGVEGVSQSQQASTATTTDGMKVLTTDGSSNTPEKRSDRDNESEYEYQKRIATDHGNELFVYNGIISQINEANREQQPPAIFIVKDTSPVISFSYKSSNLRSKIGCRNRYVDPTTGKVIDNTFMAPQPPAGTKSMLNLRERPPLSGENDDAVDYPGDAQIGSGAPGTEGTLVAQVEFVSGPGYSGGQSPGLPS